MHTLTHTDQHLQIINQDLDRKRQQAHRSPRTRRPLRRVAGLGVALAALVGAFAIPSAARADGHDQPIGCERADDTYVSGCRLVPGRPDGWFVPPTVDTAATTTSTVMVPSSVR